jgi:hypothetical protein
MEKKITYDFEVDNIVLGFTPKENENGYVEIDGFDSIKQAAAEMGVSKEMIIMLHYFRDEIIECVKKDMISLYERIDELEEKLADK